MIEEKGKRFSVYYETSCSRHSKFSLGTSNTGHVIETIGTAEIWPEGGGCRTPYTPNVATALSSTRRLHFDEGSQNVNLHAVSLQISVFRVTDVNWYAVSLQLCVFRVKDHCLDKFYSLFYPKR